MSASLHAVPHAGPAPRSRRFRVGDFQDLLPEHLSIDVRALAAFRIGIGVLILLDLLNRSRYLVENYTDAGVLPRSELSASQNPLHLSLHVMSGEAWVQAFLFIIAALFALALVAGIRTRLVTVVSWVLLASLHARNPYLLNSSDTLLRLYLFWGMFLPLGAAYSVDRALDQSGQDPPVRYRTVPAAALLLQVVLVYVTTVVYKFDPVWVTEGRAVQHSLMLQEFATDLGAWLVNFPTLLRAATHGTLLLELAGPLLLVSSLPSDRIRVWVVAAFMMFHGSFIFLMTLGLFPLISMIGWVVFLPSSFWDRLSQRLRSTRGSNTTIYFDGGCPFCHKTVRLILCFFMLPRVHALPAQDDQRAATELRARNSWIIETDDGRRLYGIAALAHVASISRLAWPLGEVLRIRWVRSAAQGMYGRIAGRRRAATTAFRLLPWRNGSWSTRRSTEVIAFVLLAYVCAWNVAGMGSRQELPRSIRWAGELLRLDQRWSMFAPYPLWETGWWQVTGTLADGRRVELMPAVRHARFDAATAPASALADFRSHRWRKYFERLYARKFAPDGYVSYLCRDWGRRFAGAPPMERVDLLFHYRRISRTYNLSDVMTAKIYSHTCTAQPSGDEPFPALTTQSGSGT